MNIAQVGAHGSDFDSSILFDTLELLELQLGILKLDLIDLRNDRDFLAETYKYDIVILTYIFILTPEEYKQDPGYHYIDDKRSFQTSPLHSATNWRARLLSTEAAEILIFGYSAFSEVTGEYIGQLPGYQLSVITDPNGTVWHYKRIT